MNTYTLLNADTFFRIHYVQDETGKVVARTFEGEYIQVTDGHHTFEELYSHRHALFIALLKIYDNYITPLQSHVKCWKSQLHSDGTMYEGWFIAGMSIKQFDGTQLQISYHLPIELWEKVQVVELIRGLEWDGHTPDDVIQRLYEL